MAKSTATAVYATPTVATPIPTQPSKATPVLNEKAVVQQWFKRLFFSLLRKTLIVASLVTLGSYLEYKYHWLGASHANVQAVAKKGAK
jgi:hypothetical protein